MSTPASKPRIASGLTSALVLMAAIASLSVITWGYVTNWMIAYSSDTALIGLIARSILVRGELPIFVWSVGYQGMLLEAYPTALFFKIFGVNPVVLNFAPAMWLWIALAVWWVSITRVFGGVAASMAVLLTVFSTPLFYHLNLRTTPNFPEILALGGLMFTLVSSKSPRPVLMGFTVGLALYTFAISIFFSLTLFVCAATWLYREELRRDALLFFKTWIVPTERLASLPLAMRSVTKWLSVLALIAMFIGAINIHKSDEFDFFGRGIKWNPINAIVTAALVLIGPRLMFELIGMLRQSKDLRVFVFKFAVGFVIGYLPALIYRVFLGGSSSKKAFASGSWSDLEERFDTLVQFHKTVFGLNGESWTSWVSAAFALVCILAFLSTSAKLVSRYIRHGHWADMRTAPWAFIIPIIFGIFLVSRSVVDIHSQRYLVFLIPVYSVAIAATVTKAWSSHAWTRPLLITGVAGFLWHGGTAIKRDLDGAPTSGPWTTIMRELDARGLKLGYADYWLAYSTNFLSNEKITLEPIYSNYSPHYAEPVKAAMQIAYVDFDPPRIKQIGDLMEIKGESYRVTETAKIGDGVVLRVLDKTSAEHAIQSEQQ